MDLFFVLLIAAGALVLGGVGGYLIFRYVIKGKYKEMIDTASKTRAPAAINRTKNKSIKNLC